MPKTSMLIKIQPDATVCRYLFITTIFNNVLMDIPVATCFGLYQKPFSDVHKTLGNKNIPTYNNIILFFFSFT